MIQRSFALAWLALATAAVTFPAHGDYRYLRVPRTLVLEGALNQYGFIVDHLRHEKFALGYLPEAEWKNLDPAVRSRAVSLDAWEWATHPHDPVTLERLASPSATGPHEPYHDYATLTAELRQMAAAFPRLARLESAGKSVEGRDLWLLRLTSADTTRVDKPKLLYIAAMHGDEVTGKEMLVYLARQLLAGFGSDPRITALLTHAEVFLMPSMNPDGTEARRRWNAKGVDLNRDFPEAPETAASSKRAPETVAVMALHERHRFEVSLNFHGGSLCVNIPWDHRPNSSNLFGDDALIRAIGREYTRLNKPMYDMHFGSFDHGLTYGYEWYQILGGMQDWSILFFQSTHSTVELSEVKWPDASQLPAFWSHNRDALLTFLERGIEGVHLRVLSPEGRLLPARVEVDSATRGIDYAGYVHRPTLPGTRKVSVRSQGYRPVELGLTAKAFDGAFTDVKMEPALLRNVPEVVAVADDALESATAPRTR